MPLLDDAQFQPASDQSLLVHLGNEISPETHHRVLKLLRLLESQPIPGVRNLHPAYASLLIVFDALQLRHEELEQILRGYLARSREVSLPEPRLVEIPVCYGGEFGPDLDDVARMRQLTPAQVIDLHASATYLVYFLGFAPGFAYLGGTSGSLVTPRLASPRRKCPPEVWASPAIKRVCIPSPRPAAGRLIGRTPIAMFRPDRSPMNLLSIGDHVRFTPISTRGVRGLADAPGNAIRPNGVESYDRNRLQPRASSPPCKTSDAPASARWASRLPAPPTQSHLRLGNLLVGNPADTPLDSK